MSSIPCGVFLFLPEQTNPRFSGPRGNLDALACCLRSRPVFLDQLYATTEIRKAD